MCYTLLYLLRESRCRICCTNTPCEGGSAPFNPPKIQRKGELKMNKDLYFSFRVSEEEKLKIDKKIEKSKLKKSDFLRKTVLEKEIVIIEDFKEFFIELKKHGTNINQIARVLNSGGSAELEEIAEFTAEYKKLNDLIGKIVGKL